MTSPNGPGDGLNNAGSGLSGIGPGLSAAGGAVGGIAGGGLSALGLGAGVAGDAATDAGHAVNDLAMVEKVAEQIFKFFLPSNLLRAACLLAGGFFIFLGVVLVAREMRNR